MNPLLELEDNREFYVMILEYEEDGKQFKDMSIFIRKEIEELYEIHERFDREIRDPVYSYKSESSKKEKYFNAIYTFRNCKYLGTWGDGLPYESNITYCDKNEINRIIMEEVKKNKEHILTMNGFREWVSENYETIKNNYDIIRK